MLDPAGDDVEGRHRRTHGERPRASTACSSTCSRRRPGISASSGRRTSATSSRSPAPWAGCSGSCARSPAAFAASPRAPRVNRKILLLPCPGEIPTGFGLTVVEQFFRDAGWDVTCDGHAAGAGRPPLQSASEWFDVVGPLARLRGPVADHDRDRGGAAPQSRAIPMRSGSWSEARSSSRNPDSFRPRRSRCDAPAMPARPCPLPNACLICRPDPAERVPIDKPPSRSDLPDHIRLVILDQPGASCREPCASRRFKKSLGPLDAQAAGLAGRCRDGPVPGHRRRRRHPRRDLRQRRSRRTRAARPGSGRPGSTPSRSRAARRSPPCSRTPRPARVTRWRQVNHVSRHRHRPADALRRHAAGEGRPDHRHRAEPARDGLAAAHARRDAAGAGARLPAHARGRDPLPPAVPARRASRSSWSMRRRGGSPRSTRPPRGSSAGPRSGSSVRTRSTCSTRASARDLESLFAGLRITGQAADLEARLGNGRGATRVSPPPCSVRRTPRACCCAWRPPEPRRRPGAGRTGTGTLDVSTTFRRVSSSPTRPGASSRRIPPSSTSSSSPRRSRSAASRSTAGSGARNPRPRPCSRRWRSTAPSATSPRSIRGAYGSVEDVEIAAVSVAGGGQPCLGFTIRATPRRAVRRVSGRASCRARSSR